MTNIIGETIGSYRIDALIGAGGMGVVYSGTHLHLGRPAAIKVMHPHLAFDPGFTARFRQEARAAANLVHPGIVQIYDFGQQDDRLYLVMELLLDGSVRTLLRSHSGAGIAIPLELGLDLVSQAAEALGYAHHTGMVHRDIKPDNLLLRAGNAAATTTYQPTYQVKICDFGLARMAEGNVTTASGMLLGSPAYMSPEQCQGHELDGRSDLYSLGIVLYQIVTGRLPFEVKTPTDAAYRHIFAEPPRPREVMPSVPAQVESIIMRCLAKRPDERIGTMNELAGVLREVARGFASMPTIPGTPPSARAEVTGLRELATSGDAEPPVSPSPPLPALPVRSSGVVAASASEQAPPPDVVSGRGASAPSAPADFAGRRRWSVWAAAAAAALLVLLAAAGIWWRRDGADDDRTTRSGDGSESLAAASGDLAALSDGPGVVTYTSDGQVFRIPAASGGSPENVSQALDALQAGEDRWLNVSPDGAWLLLDTTRFDDECSGWSCLAIVPGDLSTGVVVRVDDQVIHPDGFSAIGSGGQVIVFPSQEGPHDRDLWVTAQQGGQWTPPRLLTAASTFTFLAYPALSHDGSRVVFDCSPQRHEEQGTAICEVLTDGTGFRVVASPTDSAFGLAEDGALHHPDYRSDGAIVFEATGYAEQIWHVHPGGTPTQLVADLNQANTPCVLPDDRVALLWFSWTDGVASHELKVAYPDGSGYEVILSDLLIEDGGLGCGG
jgi:serine/threonine protein kinase